MIRLLAKSFLAILFGIIVSCGQGNPPLFKKLEASKTGVHFANHIKENDSLNVIDYAYLYNGSGVGVGDVNNDGLPDIFFAGNQVSSQLYLNQGDFSFTKITKEANVITDRWATGVAMVDINSDGWLDIYVCVASKFDSTLSRNYFFINQGVNQQGVPIFDDKAEEFGLADAGYSTQAAFFDYDLDGDLDMYLLTNGMEDFNHNLARPKKIQGEGISTDRLYRNDSPLSPSIENHQIKFTDVSEKAGIMTEGYGLGIGISDINQDGWPDVYTANDFITNDLLWINNGDGTFIDKADIYLKHHSHNGMGTDLADFNNDGLVDIMVLDMLPEDNYRQKTMLGKPNYDRFQLNTSFGYTPQYVRNTLQLNQGFTPEGHPSFSEIGQLAGVHNTDWSWSALFADYDNDGFRDLLITNGYVKDVTNLDFVTYLSASSQFGTKESKRNKSKALTSMLKEAKIHNYLFRNNGDDPEMKLIFTDVSAQWGMKEPSFSNGTAYADLDLDGDLDLVMNNINETAFIYENQTSNNKDHHYLRIRLEGPKANPAGYQAEIYLYYDGKMQYHYHSPYRGYKSTVEPIAHFGLGAITLVDSVFVKWPNGDTQKLTEVATNQVLSLSYSNATSKIQLPAKKTSQPLLVEVTDSLGIDWKHKENSFNDFNYQPLLHRSFSQEGPSIAVGDVNGDDLEDFFVGGSKNQPGTFFLQSSDGTFDLKPLPYDSASEDLGSLLFDADQDNDLDLYVASGGNEFHADYPTYADRLYRNDGSGNFSLDSDALPNVYASSSCVKAADYDQDGDLDLFVGGRIKPQEYPLPVSSYILENVDGVFNDMTTTIAPDLLDIGLVTDALWTDFNNDQLIDLIVVGEWMPITFLENQQGTLVNITSKTKLPNTSGWWTSLAAGDFDQDGDTDYVAGNAGLNTKYRASEEEPIYLYTDDFDANGSIDPILSRYIQGTEYATHSRGQLIDQLVGMRKRFTSYEAYAHTPFSELFTSQELSEVYILESVMMSSSYLENLGNSQFRINALPTEAQIAPIYGMEVEDVNHDGYLDLLTVGNSHAPETQQGWFDASIGLVLLGDSISDFHPLPLSESGFFVDSDAKAMAIIHNYEGKPFWMISSNNDSLVAYRNMNQTAGVGLSPQPLDAFMKITYQDGRSEKREFYYGSSYLSQSSRQVTLVSDIKQIIIQDYQGNERILPISSVAVSNK